MKILTGTALATLAALGLATAAAAEIRLGATLSVTGPAAFTNVHEITMDPRGRVWVGDRGAKKILIFDVDGRYLESIQMDVYVCSFYVAKDGQLYMLSGWDGQIIKRDVPVKRLAPPLAVPPATTRIAS